MKDAYVLFLLLHLQLVWTDSESLSLCINLVKSSGFNTMPEYIHKNTLNDVTIFHYDSDMDSKMPCPDWINSTTARQEWKYMQLRTDRIRRFITQGFKSAIQQFNLTGSLAGSNIYQSRGCCSLYPNGTNTSSLTHTFNGRDFLSLDFDKKTFVATVPEAAVYKHHRDGNEGNLRVLTNFFSTVCLQHINLFKNAPALCAEKVPEVQIFKQKKKVGSITVTCHVTGFYPREIQVVWLGPDLQPVDEGVTEVLPNGDGTYQTRKSVIVPEEDVGKHTYSCVVLHISVPNNITVWDVEKRSRIAVWMVLACVCLVVTAFGIWSCCRSNDDMS